MSEEKNEDSNAWKEEALEQYAPVLKFQKQEVKLMTRDYEDQTCEGKREFKEERLADGIVREYIYKVSFKKYIKDPRPLGRPKKEDSTSMPIAKMYHFNKHNSIFIDPTKEEKPKSVAIKAATDGAPRKRGRPRKYLPGEEPYKARKVSSENFMKSHDKADGSSIDNKEDSVSKGNIQNESIKDSSCKNKDNENYIDDNAGNAPVNQYKKQSNDEGNFDNFESNPIVTNEVKIDDAKISTDQQSLNLSLSQDLLRDEKNED